MYTPNNQVFFHYLKSLHRPPVTVGEKKTSAEATKDANLSPVTTPGILTSLVPTVREAEAGGINRKWKKNDNRKYIYIYVYIKQKCIDDLHDLHILHGIQNINNILLYNICIRTLCSLRYVCITSYILNLYLKWWQLGLHHPCRRYQPFRFVTGSVTNLSFEKEITTNLTPK